MRTKRIALFLALLCCACTTNRLVRQVRTYHAAHERRDLATEARLLAPDARMWFEERKGAGEPLRPGGDGRYAHWDAFFRSKSTLTDWKVEGNAVSAIAHETNDFYRLLDWHPVPYRMTWWLDDNGKITAAMVQSLPGKATNRLSEFREWAAAHHPEELEYLMPKGHVRKGWSGC
jgi:hypothetical protein